jgi:seryl-tRNA synthetase
MLKGRKLDSPLFLTTRAVCFRCEKTYEPLKRQWNFSMREIVCVGGAEDVKKFLDDCRKDVEELLKKIDLPCKFEPATDPFFNPSRNPKYLAQKLDPVKTEMIFQGLAIGSVNFHRNYFGEAFQIQSDGKESFSGCVAFGLERWVHAIRVRYGTDEEKWPDFSKF